MITDIGSLKPPLWEDSSPTKVVEYPAQQMRRALGALRGKDRIAGPADLDGLLTWANSTAEWAVYVSPGRSWIPAAKDEDGAYLIDVHDTVKLPVAPSVPGQYRRDLVYAGVDGTGATVVAVLQGAAYTSADQVKAPALPGQAIAVALIDITPGMSGVTQVQDVRYATPNQAQIMPGGVYGVSSNAALRQLDAPFLAQAFTYDSGILYQHGSSGANTDWRPVSAPANEVYLVRPAANIKFKTDLTWTALTDKLVISARPYKRAALIACNFQGDSASWVSMRPYLNGAVLTYLYAGSEPAATSALTTWTIPLSVTQAIPANQALTVTFDIQGKGTATGGGTIQAWSSTLSALVVPTP